nr:MAG TPA: hypothetical protein [Caudoviricetes sp.]
MNPKKTEDNCDKNLKIAVRYYLNCLDADSPEMLCSILGIKPKQAVKIINFAYGSSPAYGTHMCGIYCRYLEQTAHEKGFPYSIDAPGKWRLNIDDVRDILSLCEIRSIDDCATLIGGDKALSKKLMWGKEKHAYVYASTLKKICEVTGSLPEEIAEKVRSA